MFGGCTNWFYSDAEYGVLSAKVTFLFTSLLTILMVFYAGHGKKYLEDQKRKDLVNGAGILGMVYACLALVDAFIISKYKSVRIFNELSLVAAYACLWVLVFILFDKMSLWFLGVSAVVIFGGVLLAVRRHDGGWRIRTGKSDPRFTEIVNALRSQGDKNGNLELAALMALMLRPQEPEAEELFRAVLANLPKIPPTGKQSTQTNNAATGENRKRLKKPSAAEDVCTSVYSPKFLFDI